MSLKRKRVVPKRPKPKGARKAKKPQGTAGQGKKKAGNKRARYVLTEARKDRIVALATGTVRPRSEREKHFLQLCKGKADRIAGEESAWLAYLIRQAATFARMAESNAEHVRELRTKLVEEQQRGERMQAGMAALQKQIQWARGGGLPTRQPAPVVRRPQTGICPVCNGDGGAKGECYKCGGTGWIP